MQLTKSSLAGQPAGMRCALTIHRPAVRGVRTSIRAAVEADKTSPSTPAEQPIIRRSPEHPTPRINQIPQSHWEDGIPPVMGGHLMASGSVSPLSTSKGAGRTPEAFKFYYPPALDGVQVLQYINAAAAAKGLADQLAAASEAAIAARGAFAVALSGGSLVKALFPTAERKDIDFSKWHVFWVDERVVSSHTSPDSSYGAAQDLLLERAGIPEANVHAVRAGLSVQDAAIEYAGRMLGLDTDILPRNAGDLPVLDAVLLGLGPDGHVASLFPNRSQLADSTGRWILPVLNSPKPPSERVTMSLPVINAAQHVFFVANGLGKAEVVQRVLETQALPGALPAQLVRPTQGSVTWVLDAEAAHELRVGDWQNSKAWPRNQIPKAK